MNDDIRIDPGIKISHLLICLAVTFLACMTGSIIFLAFAIYFWFSAIVAYEFWPVLSDEEIKQIRRQNWIERQSGPNDNQDSDLQERSSEDTDRD